MKALIVSSLLLSLGGVLPVLAENAPATTATTAAPSPATTAAVNTPVAAAATTTTAAGATTSTATTTTTTTTTAAPAATTAPATRTLQGEVQVVTLDLQDLQNVELDLKRVRVALKHLYDEAARQPVQIEDEPEMIGDTIIYIPISFSGGGFLPMRKAWVDASMATIKPFVQLAKSDVDDFTSGAKQLEFPDKIKAELQPLVTKWAETTNGMTTRLAALEPLTSGPTYDNQAILDATKNMDRDMKELEKTRKDMYKILQKEGKRVKEKAKREANS